MGNTLLQLWLTAWSWSANLTKIFERNYFLKRSPWVKLWFIIEKPICYPDCSSIFGECFVVKFDLTTDSTFQQCRWARWGGGLCQAPLSLKLGPINLSSRNPWAVFIAKNNPGSNSRNFSYPEALLPWCHSGGSEMVFGRMVAPRGPLWCTAPSPPGPWI